MEHTEGKLDKTDVTELQILREHTDYLSVISVHKDTIFSASGDENIYLHRYNFWPFLRISGSGKYIDDCVK